MTKIEVDVEKLDFIRYLVKRAYNEQINSEYYEVLDILFELREILDEILGDEE